MRQRIPRYLWGVKPVLIPVYTDVYIRDSVYFKVLGRCDLRALPLYSELHELPRLKQPFADNVKFYYLPIPKVIKVYAQFENSECYYQNALNCLDASQMSEELRGIIGMRIEETTNGFRKRGYSRD